MAAPKLCCHTHHLQGLRVGNSTMLVRSLPPVLQKLHQLLILVDEVQHAIQSGTSSLSVRAQILALQGAVEAGSAATLAEPVAAAAAAFDDLAAAAAAAAPSRPQPLPSGSPSPLDPTLPLPALTLP